MGQKRSGVLLCHLSFTFSPGAEAVVTPHKTRSLRSREVECLVRGPRTNRNEVKIPHLAIRLQSACLRPSYSEPDDVFGVRQTDLNSRRLPSLCVLTFCLLTYRIGTIIAAHTGLS